MWLCLREGFLSVVDKSPQAGCLVVRARVKKHLKAIFPNAQVHESRNTDYRYRAHIPRREVAARIVDEIMSLSYSNFKDSVRDGDYHDALFGVWKTLGDLQPGGPYSRGK
jgi:hypothetical protein